LSAPRMKATEPTRALPATTTMEGPKS
jgi:hypothetical protein